MQHFDGDSGAPHVHLLLTIGSDAAFVTRLPEQQCLGLSLLKNVLKRTLLV